MRWVAILVAVWAGQAQAQDRALVLAADAGLAASGLLAYIVPRFALKHGVRPEVVTGALEGADAVLVADRTARELEQDGLALARRGAFYVDGGERFAVAVLAAGANPGNAQKFADWLVSEIGQRTVAGFEGAVAYLPGAPAVEAVAEVGFDGDPVRGAELAQQHCGRCHVVSQKNRFGGIGSTPSFMALRSIPGWEGKFMAFWAENPHPSFLHVKDVTEPFDPDRPPHIAPVVIELDDVDAILAYVAGIEPMDLGAPIVAR